MFEFIAGFFAKNPSIAARDPEDPEVLRELRRRKWSVFFAITFGYGFYYVCRLSFSVAKSSMAEAGIFDAAELGLIGSTIFFAYAFGKLANGILAGVGSVIVFRAILYCFPEEKCLEDFEKTEGRSMDV